MKGKREADNNFNFKSEKLDELRSRVDAAFDEHGDEAWEQIKGIFTHPKRLLVAALAAVLLVGVITVGGYLLKIRAPELPNRDGDTQDPGQTDVDLDYGDGVRPRVSGERKSKDFYTVLVLGRDTGGGGNTDTMLLASYDVTNQKATVMSIPRDTMVNVPWDVKKINSVYNYYGGGDKGIKALYKEISQLVGFEPDYQVVVEWEAVGAIVEAIGGVYFDVPYNMDYHDQYQDLVIEQEKGYRKLNGDDAMQVIRWRKNDSNSPYGNPQIGDSGRMQIQQDFLKAVIKQLLQLENVPNLGKLAEVFRENVETDLSFENILWFGKRAVIGGLSLEDVSFMTMPWTGIYVYSRTLSAEYGRTMKLDYVVPQANALLDLVNDSLSPFTEKFTLRDLDIMSVNRLHIPSESFPLVLKRIQGVYISYITINLHFVVISKCDQVVQLSVSCKKCCLPDLAFLAFTVSNDGVNIQVSLICLCCKSHSYSCGKALAKRTGCHVYAICQAHITVAWKMCSRTVQGVQLFLFQEAF